MTHSQSFNNRFIRARRNPDHARRRHTPAPSDAEIEQRLNDLVKPAVFRQVAYYRHLELRNRILTLPVMVAAVLAMIWRQVPGVCTLQRMLARECVLWSEPVTVSQPALSERFLTFPAELFEQVLRNVLDQLPARRAARTAPVPPLFQALCNRFAACYALDGTTLEALFRNRLLCVYFLRCPHGQWARQLEKTGFTVEQVLRERPHLRDRIVHVGQYRSNPSQYPVRLIEVGGTWHRSPQTARLVDPSRPTPPNRFDESTTTLTMTNTTRVAPTKPITLFNS